MRVTQLHSLLLSPFLIPIRENRQVKNRQVKNRHLYIIHKYMIQIWVIIGLVLVFQEGSQINEIMDIPVSS